MDTVRNRSNPYNFSNILLTESDVLNILNKLNIQDYTINNLSLFQQSFVHTSYCNNSSYDEYEKSKDCLPLFNKSYETQEFLGDSLLGYVITNYLYNRFVKFHEKNEGFLTKLKIRFVCGEQLSFLSRELNLNKFMIISKHIEEKYSGRENDHILEDIFEAFIGALYLDSNGDNNLIEKFIVNCIETHIDIVDLILNDNNYKDQLLRYVQHNYSVHPQYETIKDENNNCFICSIKIKSDNGIICVSKGWGFTKKKSEQDAA